LKKKEIDDTIVEFFTLYPRLWFMVGMHELGNKENSLA
jgi:hypothetical protein